MVTRSPHRRGAGDQLRSELIRAATTLLLAARPAQTPSLRAIARECGVAPSAVYLHFPSQDALMTAIVTEQFAHLRAALDAADDATATVQVRLAALAVTYVRWGLAHPGAYQLLFEQSDPDIGPGVGPGTDLLDRVARLLGRTNGVAEARVDAVRLWAALHGLASLRIHKPGAPWEVAVDADAGAIVSAFLRSGG